MPQGVRDAFIEVVRKEGKLNEEESEKYIRQMELRNRYAQETWY